ncbi:MAG: hypothetical protein K2M60_08540 [Lachnospiraceae bacterium]|nr:hypothetical protein [Lachnospiraceae bacterium]MDE6251518.1 hypothetical protein [Lachnospiraceae bacterium]
MKKIFILSISICIIFMATGCGIHKSNKIKEDTKTTSSDDKKLDFTKIDRLGFQDGNKEIFTEDKNIIDKMFLKDTVYIEEKEHEVYYGQSIFYAYHGEQLLYEIAYPTDEYVCINGIWYSVKNPPDYQEVSHLIHEENKD